MQRKFKQILAALLLAVILIGIVPIGDFAGLNINLDWIAFNSKASAEEEYEFATTGQCGENVYYSFDRSSGRLTISGKGDMWDNCDLFINSYEIIDVIICEGITSVGEDMFSCCHMIKSVVIPNSVTKISDDAFYGCDALKKIDIPNNVTYIGNGAFNNCEFTNIKIPEGVTFIGSRTFGSCSSLTNIVIPNTVTAIYDNAFDGCSSLTSVSIPDSVTFVGDEAFSMCSSLNNIKLSNNLESIGYGAFSYCESLKSIKIPESVKSIGTAAFIKCTKLSNIEFPTNVEKLGGSLLDETEYYNTSSNWENGVLYIGNWLLNTLPERIMNDIVIKETTKYIAEYAFRDCENITSISIPEGVEYIGKDAFYNCMNLIQIKIPSTTVNIENRIFVNCYKLERIEIDDKNLKYDSRDNCNAVIETFSNTLIVGCKNSSIPYDVIKIGDYAFSGCSGFSEIKIPDSVKEIGAGAFAGTDIKSITIPNGVTSIKECTFNGCEFLKDITIPASIKSISLDDAFGDCDLSNVFFEGSADDWCNINYVDGGYDHIITDNLYIQGNLPTEITLSDKVTSIPDYAFYNCKTLKSIKFSDSVERIGSSAFNGCTSLKELFIPAGVTDIEYGKSFEGCSGLQSIVVSEENRIYDSRNNCNALIKSDTNDLILGCKNTKIPNTVKTIDDSAFEDCVDLKDINIPNGVEEILESAFRGCTGLTSIYIPKSLNYICYSSFLDCAELKSILVDPENQYFSNDRYGILYNKNFSKLLRCPPALNVEFTMPDSVAEIQDSSFEGCYNVTVKVPFGTTEIKSNGKYSNICHAQIYIPETVLTIEDGSFSEYYEHLIAPIYVDEKNPNYSSDEYGNIYNKEKSEIVGVQEKYYDNPDNWENGVMYLAGNYLYEGAQQNLGKSGPPHGVEVTGDYKIKEGTKYIRYGAFGHCWPLRSIYIPSSIKTISSKSFIDTGLENITISEGVQEIENMAFYFCLNLKEITIPKSVKKIGSQALGYYGYVDKAGSKVEGFKIYCYADTAGEKYAIDNDFEYELLDKPHTHTLNHITVPSTCKVAGMEYDICLECGETFNEKTLPLAAHTWSEWTVVKEATTTAEGQEKRTCSVCDKVETRAIEKLKVIKDDKTGIEINYNDEYDSDTEIKVEEQFSGKSFQLINTEFGKVNSKIYDIATYKDGVKVQPNGEITVKVPLPDGFTTNKVFVCYVDSVSGKVTKIPCEVKDGYVIFKTNHFSEYAIVEQSANVKSVSVSDIKLNYKKSATIKPTIKADEGAKYTVKYSSSNTKVATVDENGKVYAAKKGSATITCTVTDSNGNTVQDTCKVTVKYSFGQWLIKILLFGWIWY